MDAITLKAAVNTLRRVCVPEEGDGKPYTGKEIIEDLAAPMPEEQRAIDDFVKCLAPATLRAVVMVVRAGRFSKRHNDEAPDLILLLREEKSPEPESYLQGVHRNRIHQFLNSFEKVYGTDYAFANSTEFELLCN